MTNVTARQALAHAQSDLVEAREHINGLPAAETAHVVLHKLTSAVEHLYNAVEELAK